MDNLGVSNKVSNAATSVKSGGKAVGSFISGKAAAVGGAVNSKIEENPNLAAARDGAKQKVSAMSKMISTGVWSVYAKARGIPSQQ